MSAWEPEPETAKTTEVRLTEADQMPADSGPVPEQARSVGSPAAQTQATDLEPAASEPAGSTAAEPASAVGPADTQYPPLPTHAEAIAKARVEEVEEALRDVVDPELGINIVDLGLVYGLTVDEQNLAVIDMTLTSAACPLTDVIEDQISAALQGMVADYRLNWVWMPPWGVEKITEDGREQLRALGFSI